MASKLHEGNSVAERRLRPIYEFMENGNSKKALQEADKVLKKQPNFQCAKVLKALALLRLGREHECEKILEGVMAESPVDDTILQAMTVCFRDLQKPEMICEIYDKAVSIDPNSEELLSHLFMAYVRISDYQKQKQTALALYKLKPKNPYYFWAVMSIVMQAHTADSHATKGIVLSVAERMISNFIKEGKIETEQEVQLYLMVLEMQGKHKEALEILNGPLGKKLDPHLVTTTKRIDLSMKLGLWKEVNVYLKEQLLDEIDAWSNYCHYFTSVFHLCHGANPETQTIDEKQNKILKENGVCIPSEQNISQTVVSNFDGLTGNAEDKCQNLINDVRKLVISEENVKNGEPHGEDECRLNGDCEDQLQPKNDEADSKSVTTDNSLDSCINFLSRLRAENERLKHPLRGPLLAPLELYRRLAGKKIDPVPFVGDLVSLLMAYFRKFGSKQCCLSDIQNYLTLLNKNQTSDLLQQIQDLVGLQNDDLPSEVFQMQCHINYLQICRFLGFQDSADVDKMKLAVSMWKYYLHGNRFNSGPVGSNPGHNDPYILLAAHVLHDLWWQENSSTYLIYAITILEYALSVSPSNYQFKLLLLKFYNLFGAVKAAFKFAQLLDIKHVQLVSLGYLVQDPLLASGHFSMATHFYESTLKFFQSNVKDNSDFMIISYKFGSFLKIGEFLEFRDKLNNSLLHYFVKVEQFLLEIFTAANYQTVIKKAPSDCLTVDCDILNKLEDNRNDNIFNMCNPSNRRSTPELLRQSFELDVSLLKLRIFTLRCIIAAADMNKRSIAAAETLIFTRKSLETLINKLKEENLSPLPQNVLSGVSKPRLFLYLESPYYFPYLCQLLTIAQKLGEPDLDTALAAIEEANSILSKSVDHFAEALSDNLDSRLHERESLTVLIEMFCLSTVFCGILSSLAKTDKVSAPKQSKKKVKKETATSNEQRTNLNNRKVSCDTIYITNVLKAGKALEAILSTASESWVQIPNVDFSEFFNSFSENTAQIDDFHKAIGSFLVSLKSSYGSSITESSNLLSQKLKFISELNV